jgi:signal transduction histidine kinase
MGPIKDMRAQAQRMNAIIADLLELSRLESTDGEAPREPVDVPRMLERLQRDALASPRSAAPGAARAGVRGRLFGARTSSSPPSPTCW